ncbi:Function: nothing can be assessed about the possible function from these data [Echinococcus multilocularis]|uniref:Function: nothing can be assessed about the possible function from these data n=1 Tax=Echinococcus multilocularis TaxID=6211 RepID=A0A0S4MM32_ECHMU|nr:Function: nothing can be assessed about the possible function from these data [Echinococcus multilocularis]
MEDVPPPLLLHNFAYYLAGQEALTFPLLTYLPASTQMLSSNATSCRVELASASSLGCSLLVYLMRHLTAREQTTLNSISQLAIHPSIVTTRLTFYCHYGRQHAQRRRLADIENAHRSDEESRTARHRRKSADKCPTLPLHPPTHRKPTARHWRGVNPQSFLSCE